MLGKSDSIVDDPENNFKIAFYISYVYITLSQK